LRSTLHGEEQFSDAPWKLATLISRTGTPTSKDRELPLFVESLLSHWDARHAGGRSAQPSSRVSDPLTARERDVLAMISQGFATLPYHLAQEMPRIRVRSTT
jgi:hypothetical protein